MKVSFVKYIACLAVLSLASATCSAATISGSLPLAAIFVSENGANLAVSTTISNAFDITSGSGTGDLSAVPLGSVFSSTPLDLTNFSTFVLSNPNYGAFTALGGVITTHTPTNLDVELLGIYVPGPGLASGLTPSLANLNISVNQAGQGTHKVLAEAFSLSTVTPEPASLLLLGCGAAGMVGFLRRR